ncbi:hypothetical protein L218DRAFT_964214 [Marasmius fiardii PR-910]|nr:hypothetical protein L218DRAFT_964214 [Marasmius fiardii PR-910]
MSRQTAKTSYLIPEIQRNIVSYLSPLDLLRYAMINKETNTVVKDLQRTAFRMEKVLSPFFSADEVVRFRQAQFAYKFLISGSIALSLFTREIFENAIWTSTSGPTTSWFSSYSCSPWDTPSFRFEPVRRANRAKCGMPWRICSVACGQQIYLVKHGSLVTMPSMVWRESWWKFSI